MLKEIVQYPLTIKGCSTNDFQAVKSPFNGEVLGAVAQADEEAIKKAIFIAQEAHDQEMRKMPAHVRANILSRTAELISNNQEDFARTIALEGGKPIRDARLEVARAVNTFSIAAQEALSLCGEQVPMDRTASHEGKVAMVLREPIGVIGAITPFNFPLNLVAHKLGPAIAAGNTVVLKPSSQTPISSFKLFAVLKEAGLPEGALNIVPCRGSKGQALVTSSKLSMLTFTGSPEVGWQLRKSVAPGVRLILELGGNAGIIVHKDADLKLAAQSACRGGYVNAGQSCISVQRVYAHKSIFEKFMELFLANVRGLQLGDPLNETTDVGPLIDEASVTTTLERIQAAIKAGAKLALGGKSMANNLIEPTVLTDTTKDMAVINQEVFAPIVSVMQYSTIDEAIEQINDARWGLQAGVFTNDLEVAFKAARKIDVGGVMVNDAPTFRADHQPYGGRRESGLGLEGVRYAIEEMTQPKFICLNLPKLD